MGSDQQIEVAKIAKLSFANGNVGRRYPLVGPEAEAAFAEQLGRHTYEITIPNTADCIDERRTIRLADGTNNPAILKARVVHQLPGGEGLAATKALIAADAGLIQGTKSMWEAYEKVSTMLKEMGEEDGGHEACGASKAVQSSVAEAIHIDVLVPTVGLFVPSSSHTTDLIKRNAENKRRRLEDGFYGSWEPSKHADYLISNFPQNFSYLGVDNNDRETGGHNASAAYVVTDEGVGFGKNVFIEDTGRQSFALSQRKMQQLAHMLGGSPQERDAIMIGFVDDALHVAAGLACEDMPVFA